MFENEINFLEYLKQQKFSLKVKEIRGKILAVLNSNRFSPLLRQALENIEFEGIPFKGIESEPAQISQVKKIINALYHVESTLNHVESVDLKSPLTRATHALYLYNNAFPELYQASCLLSHIDVNIQDIFFEEFSTLMSLTTRLSQFIKAQNSRVQGYLHGYWLKPLEQDTIVQENHVYVALENSQLRYKLYDPNGHLISSSIDVEDIEPPLNSPLNFYQLKENFSTLLKILSQRGQVSLKTFHPSMLAYKAGLVAGVGVNQLQPEGGDFDYEFLTRISAQIPIYMDQWTESIKEIFSENASSHIPKNIDEKKLEELRHHSLMLLYSIENLKSGEAFFVSIQALSYLGILRHIIALSMSIIEQVGRLNDSTQDVIIGKLQILKKRLSKELVGAFDKLEETAMLQPGMLSNHLMRHLNQFYAVIIDVVKRHVDLESKQPELLVLNDSVFLGERLKRAYLRRADLCVKQNQFIFQKEKTEEFFNLLEKQSPHFTRVIDFPEDIKGKLKDIYPHIQPLVVETRAFDEPSFIQSLNERRGALSYYGDFWEYIVSSHDAVSVLLTAKDKILRAIEKKQATGAFQQKLNEQLCENMIASQPNISLCVYPDDKQLYSSYKLGFLIEDERQLQHPLTNEELLAADNNEFNLEHAQALFSLYAYEVISLNGALQSYQFFVELVTGIDEYSQWSSLSDENKRILRPLYAVFQPHWVNLPCQTDAKVEFDKAIIKTISEGQEVPTFTIKKFNELKDEFLVSLTNKILHCSEKMEYFRKEMDKASIREISHDTLISYPPEERDGYVVPHTYFSETVAKLRQFLCDFTQVFNSTIQRELCPNLEGLPFPEIENELGACAHSHQVLLLKRFFNTIYHIDQAAIYLERLNNKSSRKAYVEFILQVSYHTYETFLLLQAIYASPYAVHIAGKILQRITKEYQWLKEVAQPYIPEVNIAYDDSRSYLKDMCQWSLDKVKSLIGSQDKQSISTESQALENETPDITQHILNALFVLPEHITEHDVDGTLAPEKIKKCQERAQEVAQNIQRIIKHSNSYVKLCFEIPTMYRLFSELKSSVLQVTKQSNEFVVDNLESLKNHRIPEIMKEVDLWEDQLGLLPGTVSGPIQEILEQYFIGLIEPLALPSFRHLALVGNSQSYKKRINAVQSRLEDLKGKLEKARNKYDLYQRLLDAYEKMQVKEEPYAIDILLKSAEEVFDDYYLFEDKCVSPKETLREDALQYHLEKGRSYYDGLVRSHRLAIDTMGEKLQYLDVILKEKSYKFNQYHQRYTAMLFDESALKLSSKKLHLIYTEVEYTESLKNYLNGFKEQIVTKALSADDTRESITQQLKEKARIFERKNYQDFYRLNKVKEAILQFRSYINIQSKRLRNSQWSLFLNYEDNKTLEEKNALILKLKDIAYNQDKEQTLSSENQLSVKERLDKLATEVRKLTFADTMLRCTRHHPPTFNWLKQLVASFFELLGLYKPQHRQHFENFGQVLDKDNPAYNFLTLSKTHGLFSKESASLLLAQDQEREIDEQMESSLGCLGT